MPHDPGEVPLAGGNASGDVVLVDGTVRKPWLAHTVRVVGFMDALRAHGVDVPRTFGRDERGRLSVEFVPGRIAQEAAPLSAEVVHRVGALVRRIHDASVGLPVPVDWPVLLAAPGPAELICHNDLAPWNLVVDGDRLVFIDWDGAGPSTRLWDLAYAALAFGHLFPGADVPGAAYRLAAFVDGYDADEALRAALPTAMLARATAMLELLRAAHRSGRQPWADMFVAGHGAHWAGTVEVVRAHQQQWRRVLGQSVLRRSGEVGADDPGVAVPVSDNGE